MLLDSSWSILRGVGVNSGLASSKSKPFKSSKLWNYIFEISFRYVCGLLSVPVSCVFNAEGSVYIAKLCIESSKLSSSSSFFEAAFNEFPRRLSSSATSNAALKSLLYSIPS